MKKIIVLLLILIVPTIVMSQQKDWYYTNIVKVDSTSCQQLFDNAVIWSINNDIKNPIVIGSRMYGKGTFDLKYLGTVTYIINIQCIDGKYRYIISDFKHRKENYEKTDIISAGRTMSIGHCGMVNYSGGCLSNDKPQSNGMKSKRLYKIKLLN